MLTGFHHQQNVHSHERTKCPCNFHSMPCSRGFFCPDNSPNAIGAFDMQYGRLHSILFTFLFIHQSTATKVHQRHTWSRWKPNEDHHFIQGVPGINAQDLNRMGFGPLSFRSFNASFGSSPTSSTLFSYKFMKELIVMVVNQLSQNYKLFLLRHSLYVKL